MCLWTSVLLDEEYPYDFGQDNESQIATKEGKTVTKGGGTAIIGKNCA